MSAITHPVGAQAQRGFTLVEIAIVLVIIGLLLGGVLKGQELIENARVKEATNTLNGITAAYNGYIDRYKRIPGDDGDLTALQNRGGTWAQVTQAGNVNGVLNVGGGFANALEQPAFWQHLRAAGFIPGDPAAVGAAALPRNAWGGGVSIVNGAQQGRPSARLMICLGNVPGKAAAQLDTNLDDGNPAQGTLRATIGGNNVNPAAAAMTTPYNEAEFYTICKDMV